jgi:hypothetical protein
MVSSATLPVPFAGKRPTLADATWLFACCMRGLAELVRARIIFARIRACDIPVRNAKAATAATWESCAEERVLARIAYVLPRLSKRLPWRSDCVIQAIAAQNWLAALGHASEIVVGVQCPDSAEFLAHAWLLHGGKVVTGGDIADFSVLIGGSPSKPDDRLAPEEAA